MASPRNIPGLRDGMATAIGFSLGFAPSSPSMPEKNGASMSDPVYLSGRFSLGLKSCALRDYEPMGVFSYLFK